MKFYDNYSEADFLTNVLYNAERNDTGNLEVALHLFEHEFPVIFDGLDSDAETSERIRFIGMDVENVARNRHWFRNYAFMPTNATVDEMHIESFQDLLLFRMPDGHVVTALKNDTGIYCGDMDKFADYLGDAVDYDNYIDWEIRIEPKLKARGLRVIRWLSGEEDACGPLIRFAAFRIELPEQDPLLVRFYYG